MYLSNELLELESTKLNPVMSKHYLDVEKLDEDEVWERERLEETLRIIGDPNLKNMISPKRRSDNQVFKDMQRIELEIDYLLN